MSKRIGTTDSSSLRSDESRAVVPTWATTLPVPLQRAMAAQRESVEQSGLFGTDDVVEPARRVTTDVLLASWVGTLSHRPHDSILRRQGKVAQRLARKHTDEELVIAWIGMSRLFPYNKGTPFDLFDFERRFHMAVESGMKHPAIQAEKAKRGLTPGRGADALGL